MIDWSKDSSIADAEKREMVFSREEVVAQVNTSPVGSWQDWLMANQDEDTLMNTESDGNLKIIVSNI